MKNKHSTGPDGIPGFLVKKVRSYLVKALVFLINLFFCNGRFPESLKTGKVIPLYKKGDPFRINNYRPVTIPSCFSKILEYCYPDRLKRFLDTTDVLTHNQHGFRSGKSTLTALLSFVQRLIQLIEVGKCPIGIFCDFSRAFDCMNRDMLLSRLVHYGSRDFF
nr:unnamed protein product [Callosobruchus chinensis]